MRNIIYNNAVRKQKEQGCRQGGSKKAAGYDLYTACEKESTDLVIELPDGYFAAIYARSGLATKESLRPANCIRVV